MLAPTLTGKIKQWWKFAIIRELATGVAQFIEEAVRAGLERI